MALRCNYLFVKLSSEKEIMNGVYKETVFKMFDFVLFILLPF